jgi:hypothetical protein
VMTVVHNHRHDVHADRARVGDVRYGTIARVTGTPGVGFFRLGVVIDIRTEPSVASSGTDLPRMTELVGEVRISGRPVGSFTPAQPGYLPVQAYTARTNQRQVELVCDLDRARIEAIETARGGGHLALDVWLSWRFGDGHISSSQEQYTVNQGVWVEVLSQMDYQRTLLVEIPTPDPAAQPELAEAIRLLGEAQGHMLRGHDRDAVGALRDALDEVTRVFGDDDETIDPELKRILFDNSRNMTKAERLRVVRRALKLVTHPARHRDQVAIGMDWSRTDSAQMIAMVAAFINEMAAPDARPSRRDAPNGSTVDAADESERDPVAREERTAE